MFYCNGEESTHTVSCWKATTGFFSNCRAIVRMWRQMRRCLQHVKENNYIFFSLKLSYCPAGKIIDRIKRICIDMFYCFGSMPQSVLKKHFTSFLLHFFASCHRFRNEDIFGHNTQLPAFMNDFSGDPRLRRNISPE